MHDFIRHEVLLLVIVVQHVPDRVVVVKALPRCSPVGDHAVREAAGVEAAHALTEPLVARIEPFVHPIHLQMIALRHGVDLFHVVRLRLIIG